MTIKVTFLSIMLFFLLPVLAQDTSVQDILGQWEYEYSEESVDEEWYSYAEKDLQIVLNDDNAIFQEADEESSSEIFQQPNNAPLFLKDALLTVKVFPVSDNKKMVRFSFLQMPRGDEDFKYIDRSKGDLKGEIILEDNFRILRLMNFGETEDYKILSMSETNMVLLDMSNNTKHLFKRKQ